MQLKYVLRRAWFMCLPVPNTSDERCWRDEQRYMYLRLRRLVGSFNKHFFYKLHYERKLVLQAMVHICISFDPFHCESFSISFLLFLLFFLATTSRGQYPNCKRLKMDCNVCLCRRSRYQIEDLYHRQLLHIRDTASTEANSFIMVT